MLDVKPYQNAQLKIVRKPTLPFVNLRDQKFTPQAEARAAELAASVAPVNLTFKIRITVDWNMRDSASGPCTQVQVLQVNIPHESEHRDCARPLPIRLICDCSGTYLRHSCKHTSYFAPSWIVDSFLAQI